MTLLDNVIFCCLLMTAAQPADNPPNLQSASDKGESAARMEHMKQAAKSYKIALAPDAAKKLILIEEPVLRFADHVTGVVDGTVFVWMMDDRPGATASVWIQKSGYEFHEFQSLAASPLIASNQGQPKWTPAEPGIERKPAPVTQPPAATAARRLNQMRTLRASTPLRSWTRTITGRYFASCPSPCTATASPMGMSRTAPSSRIARGPTRKSCCSWRPSRTATSYNGNTRSHG